MENIDRIALIAGNGNFPIFLTKAAKASGIQVIVAAVESEADRQIEKIADKVYWLNLGEGKRLIEVLKKEQIQYAIMAGKITKTTIIKESLNLDEEAKNIFKRVIDRRDDTILKAVANRLKELGVELLDSTTFVHGMMPSRGTITKKKPDTEQMQDIDFGYKIAKEMGRIDIGQSVIVKKKAVVAVEAIEGTDEAIKRAGRLAGPGTVVVKASKPNQDMRFDVPVVGLKTIETMKEAGASVLAIEAEKVLLLEEEEVVKAADKAGISIVAV